MEIGNKQQNNRAHNRAALYIRVSSEEISEDARYDDTRHWDVENQKNDLKQFCRKQGYILDNHHIYKDIGYSGFSSVEERPALKRLLEDMKKQKFDVMIVYKIDRLARNLKLLLKIFEDLKKYKITFKSITESFDMSSAFGESTLQMIGMFAQLERNIIKDRRKKRKC